MLWWRRKPRDPSTGGSAQQQAISTAIDEELQVETLRLRKTIEVLVLGEPSATAHFLHGCGNHLGTSLVPGEGDKQPPSEKGIPTGDDGAQDAAALCAAETAANSTRGDSPADIGGSDLADIASELYHMSQFSKHVSPRSGPHEVDLLASS